MRAILAALCLVAVSLGMGPAADGGPVAADPGGAGLAPGGSTISVFSEDFEGAFPGSQWFAGDMDSLSGADFWGPAWSTEAARVHGGLWSGWCAEEGTNSPNMDQPNFTIRAYDYNMDAFMHMSWSSSVDLSASDLAYLDFWSWSQTEPDADYMNLEWYDEGSGTWANTGPDQRITGTSGWTRHYWQTPYRYMTTGALFGFLFHSDFSEIGEGVYVDDLNLVQADVTVGSDSIASANLALPGDLITLNYHIHNPAPFPVQCGLGARIIGIEAPVGYSDAANETVVTIPSGYSWQTRTFTVPSGVPPEFGAPDGSYNISFEIWSGAPKDTADGNRFWGSAEASDLLTVDSTPPALPALVSPANGARVDNETPTFDWSDVTDPQNVYYTIEVDDNASFSSPAIDVFLSVSQHTALSALPEGRHYWRVTAEDRLGNSSGPTAAWYFDRASPSPPAVTTTAATAIGTGSATLNGQLTGLGTAPSVQVSFEWGPTAAYGHATAPQAMAGAGGFSADLSGLTANTTYHFRATAAGDGTALGSDMTFATSAAPTTLPEVTTAGAGNVTGSSARLNGSVTSMGTAATVSVSFVWGTVQGGPYPNETAGSAQTGPGAFWFDLGGLAAGTTIYYQARAAGDGTGFGAERSFTTASSAAGEPATDGGVTPTGSRVHLWVYLVAAAGGLAALGVLASLGVWLRRRWAKSRA